MNLTNDGCYVFADMDPTMVNEQDEGLFVMGEIGSSPSITIMLDEWLLETLRTEMLERDVEDGVGIKMPLDKVMECLIDGSLCLTGQIDEADAQAWSALLRAYADQIDAIQRISDAYPDRRAA